jgi:enterochelin esterase-like enzyme
MVRVVRRTGLAVLTALRSRRGQALVGISAGRCGATLLGFYVGDEDTFKRENVRLHRELSAAGVPHLFRLYRGGHSQSFWSRHASTWPGLALRHLDGS